MTDFILPSGDLLVAPETHDWVEKLLTQMAAQSFADNFIQKVNTIGADDEDGFWIEGFSLRPYAVKNGVLSVPVKGMLMSGLPYTLGSFATGYEYITAAVARGAADSKVTEIILDINSPGGTVSGCFDCADAIFAARGSKPIRAAANEAAYSAAYAIASSADLITVARTGGVGSIGVMTAHIDTTAALAARGVKITPVFAGEHKVDGQPFVPLTEEAKARMQARVDALHDIFVSTVARNRGLDEQAVRDTEAATFMASEAIEKGLADTVGSLGSLSAHADPSNQDEDEEMSNDNSVVELAAHETAVASATAQGTEAGKAAGATEERARVSAILDSVEAKTHPEAARHVALNTDMTAEAAAAFLAALPVQEKVEEAKCGDEAFTTAMNNGDNPNLGAGGDDNEPEMSTSDKIFASAGHSPANA